MPGEKIETLGLFQDRCYSTGLQIPNLDAFVERCCPFLVPGTDGQGSNGNSRWELSYAFSDKRSYILMELSGRATIMRRLSELNAISTA